jgi:glycosyltransferase involved in cell wall biosynthesis
MGLVTQPLRRLSARISPLVHYGRRILGLAGVTTGPSACVGGSSAAENCLAAGGPQGIGPAPRFEGAFLARYYRSAGFVDPPAMTFLKLRARDWPVYATRAEAEAVAAPIRASGLFDAAGYRAAAGNLGKLDPILHYVIVGERLGLPPSDSFDPQYYRDAYPDVVRERFNLFAHYLLHGRAEGRRPRSLVATLKFDRSRIDRDRETVLLVIHQASRTGAPVLAYNVATRLRERHNVVAVCLAGGELAAEFERCCAATVGPLDYADWNPAEMQHLVAGVLAAYRVSYAIVNSMESSMIVLPLARAFVPVILLVHEFPAYIRPKRQMHEGFDWANEIVFSAEVVARSAQEEYPPLLRRPVQILPQGRCDLPPVRRPDKAARDLQRLHQAFRPPGAEDAVVVLGCGTVHLRKGVDLFLACAAAVAAMRPTRPVRFVWIGDGFDPEKDAEFSVYLADQIARAGLAATVAIIDPIDDLNPAYAMADIFFLSSRLDPLPNVAIDAALRGLPVICFDKTSGIADLLRADETVRQCVVPYLDVNGAACRIAELADDEAKRRQIGRAIRTVGEAVFDMDRYVARLDALGHDAIKTVAQRAPDFATLRDDPQFDPEVFLPPDAAPSTRAQAIVDFLVRWAVVGARPGAGADFPSRRPCAGFHPQIYAHAHAGRYDTATVNPLAHFIRSGRPAGPWVHDVVVPGAAVPAPGAGRRLRVALHAHFYHPELAEDFLRRVLANRTRCDLLLSTDAAAKANALAAAAARHAGGDVHIRVVPNRGRDIGPLLTEFGGSIADDYDLVGHLHGKRSLAVDAATGDRWREFIWQNLVGHLHPMMDTIIARFAGDETLGLVFPEDPHLVDWGNNLDIANDLAGRMEIDEPLPPFFDFPVGGMFWARAAALKPLFDLRLRWDDYPEEPIPNDRTILHALERLLPFAARRAGYRFATTHVPGVTR